MHFAKQALVCLFVSSKKTFWAFFSSSRWRVKAQKTGFGKSLIFSVGHISSFRRRQQWQHTSTEDGLRLNLVSYLFWCFYLNSGYQRYVYTRDLDATLICLMCQFPSTMNVQEHFNENIMKIVFACSRIWTHDLLTDVFLTGRWLPS